MPGNSLLPVEIAGQILSHIATDIDSLKACSLAHTSFLPFTQKYLFAEFIIGRDDDHTHDIPLYRKLLEIIRSSPHLALHFRKVVLNISLRSGVVESDLLSQLLPKLRCVKSLTIKCSGPLYTLFLPSIHASVLEMIGSSSLETLEIISWKFKNDASDLIALVSPCATTLRKLWLDTDFSTPTEVIIERLELPELAELCHFRQPPFSLFKSPRLQRIQWPLHFGHEDCHATKVLSDLCGLQLRWTLLVGSSYIGLENAPPCRSLPNEIIASIQHLTLSIIAWCSEEHTISTLEYLQDTFASSALTCLTIVFVIDAGVMAEELWDDERWDRVASQLRLCVLGLCPTDIISVVFQISQWREPHQPNEELLEMERHTDPEDIEDMFIDDLDRYGDVYYRVQAQVEKAQKMMDMQLSRIKNMNWSMSVEYKEEEVVW
ncbi:hypothetical protein ONZ45_g11105 [Pleurotus djamor]|nr:hypothetical protein ONZ45_g11105 [Pleurotus djamor]